MTPGREERRKTKIVALRQSFWETFRSIAGRRPLSSIPPDYQHILRQFARQKGEKRHESGRNFDFRGILAFRTNIPLKTAEPGVERTSQIYDPSIERRKEIQWSTLSDGASLETGKPSPYCASFTSRLTRLFFITRDSVSSKEEQEQKVSFVLFGMLVRAL